MGGAEKLARHTQIQADTLDRDNKKSKKNNPFDPAMCLEVSLESEPLTVLIPSPSSAPCANLHENRKSRALEQQSSGSSGASADSASASTVARRGSAPPRRCPALRCACSACTTSLSG
eukprot:6188299-Pleurochrysis_carterae.AAC.6